MTVTLSVNENNDIHIGGDGSMVVASGIEAVKQACEQAAATLLGEMVFATDKGVPDFTAIWEGSPNVSQYEAFLRRAILAVTDVTEIVSLSVSIASGVLSYTATIRTIYGEVATNG